ncbi:hypothetical protein yc1106_01888 [Curvularia clavata]|uniref:Uncharacterized protein n=1 Tax=Curvularia clavata TaxID=95742 RepID=A0A9Q8Z4C3_CURCL|nr:hypothetical protein yc1106_01888 [Curvularia clavata]
MAEPLTVDSVSAIQAMIQELHIRAEGGNSVDEETLALRMLAATSAQPGYDLSQIKRLNDGQAPGPVTASADGDDKFNQLAELMMGNTKTPDQQVAEGKIPTTSPVVVIDPYAKENAQSNFASLKDAHSMIQLYSNLMQVQQKPGGFNITSEAAAGFAFQAKQAYNAMMGPLAGYYNFSLGSAQTYSNQLERNQIHDNFLGKVFDGFGFDKATLTALDTKLTTFVSAIKGINPGAAAPSTYDFAQILGLCPKLNITGDDSDPEWVFSPTTFLLYMKIDARTFRESISKNSSVDKVNFNFQLTVNKCELNVRRFEADRAKFDKMFNLVTNKNLRAYSDLLNQQIEQKNPPTTPK